MANKIGSKINSILKTVKILNLRLNRTVVFFLRYGNYASHNNIILSTNLNSRLLIVKLLYLHNFHDAHIVFTNYRRTLHILLYNYIH